MSVDNVEVLGTTQSQHLEILTDEALAFVADLARTFRPRVEDLLQRRLEKQAEYDAGKLPHFLEETKKIRDSAWTVAALPEDLMDRRVEITGPTTRKMVINALNSGAKVFMADFEDANAPTWDNMVLGQMNLRDAASGTITFEDKARGKSYKLNPSIATLLVRPRGWHLLEKHLLVDGKPVPGGIFDFGFYFFHNAKNLLAKGSGPYFYLPKMQSHLEARLWNDIFVKAQKSLGVPNGSIKATCLIETLPAAFEMDEFLWELRDHSAGLNCGRWDYIFSYIKTMRADASRILPDRSQVTMTQTFMRAYTQLLIQTCHKRNVHAMGGMAPQIPIKGDDKANEAALDKVREDKLREVKDGHDGTWVAHPGLVAIAKDIFDEHMSGPNQLDVKRADFKTSPSELMATPEGTRTEAGLRQNISVGVQYIEAWLRGNGCVPLYNLMEDAATAEISRTQVWQWLKYGAKLEDGQTITRELFDKILIEEMDKIRQSVGEDRFTNGQFQKARQIFDKLTRAEMPTDFLTLPAYEYLLSTQ